ncbi:MAG: flotillin, partial [Gammaproteobacteria bacterium]|nr:flotillin [Gammaproteobacteria bacterium]
MSWLVVFFIAILLLVVVIAVFNRFYHKGSREKALIRTGAGGQKIVMDGGCLVLPFLHQVELVDMRTAYMEVVLEKNNSILTEDRMRVDLAVAFHVRVIPTTEGIATAAQTVGVRSLNPERLIEFLKGRFVDVLQSVVAAYTMDDLHENRSQFVARTAELLKPSLEESGLKLESVSLVRLDQTEFSALNENNAFNAVGMR